MFPFLGDTAVILKVASVHFISYEEDKGGERLHEAGTERHSSSGHCGSVCTQSLARPRPRASAG